LSLSLTFDIVNPSEGKVFRTSTGRVLGSELELVPVKCYTVRELTLQTGKTCRSWDGINSTLSGPCIDCHHNPYGNSNTKCVDTVNILGVWSNDSSVQLALSFTDINLILGESLHRFLGNIEPINSVTLTFTRGDDNKLNVTVNGAPNDPAVTNVSKTLAQTIIDIERK
jgi:hypothetical protein